MFGKLSGNKLLFQLLVLLYNPLLLSNNCKFSIDVIVGRLNADE